jgi:outer membrane receptor protein involved in Fe transport
VQHVGVVTAHATRGEREVLDVPGNVTVIDRDEIERSGARSLPELLRRQPGIFVTNTTTNPAGTIVDARGFNNGGGNGSSLLVLVDGRRANEPDTGSADWALLPLDMIESVEIVRGPASALYGDSAVGGILHIRTRPVPGPPRAALRGLYGRYDTGGGSLRAAGTLGELTGGLFVDGLQTDGYRDRSAFDRQDVKASVEGTLFDRVVIGTAGGWHHDDREFPGALSFEQIATLGRRAASPASTESRGEVDTWNWDGWVEASLAPEIELKLLPYYFHRDDFLRDTSQDFGPFEIENDKQQGGIDLQLRIDQPLLGLTNRIIFGAAYLHDAIDRSSVGTGLFPSDTRTEGTRNVAGGFVQEELWLRKDLLLATGVRYDSGSYDLHVTDRMNGVTESDAPDLHAWSPKGSLTWRFHPIASAYASWARGFRLPDFDEDLPILGFPPGSPPLLPDLSPQRSGAFEVGAKVDSEPVQANLSLYWMRVHDEMLFDPLNFQNFNVDRVRHRGIEASASYRVLPWLTLSAAYTFDDVKIVKDANPLFDGARMPITPKHRGTLGAFAALPLGLELVGADLGANANLVGKRILASDFQQQLSKLDAYYTLDLWIRLRPSLGEHVAPTLSFMVRNVTARRYEGFGACGGGCPTAFVNPAPTRTYEVSLVVELRP